MGLSRQVWSRREGQVVFAVTIVLPAASCVAGGDYTRTTGQYDDQRRIRPLKSVVHTESPLIRRRKMASSSAVAA
jgi:hypothetical protein